jgi:adenine C2-methylase RlmN of 23S rRNA A2503 and tRNA A37
MNLLGRFRDVDGTEKFVFKNKKGVIEITWITKENKLSNVLCLPTHYYCNLGCKFCHLTDNKNFVKMGKINFEELLETINYVLPFINNNMPNLLLSFMGVGEPFLNIDLVIETFIKLRNNTNKKLNVALATMVPDIKIFDYLKKQIVKYNIPLKIHFSMHSSIDKKRNKIIPSSSIKLNSILTNIFDYRRVFLNNNKLVELFKQYHDKLDPTEIHYTIINKINDSEKELNKLIELGNNYFIPIKIIKFNPIGKLKNSKKEIYWLKILKEKYIESVTIYNPPGNNIGSSCGQFTKHYYLKTSKYELEEFKKWKEKYEIN